MRYTFEIQLTKSSQFMQLSLPWTVFRSIFKSISANRTYISTVLISPQRQCRLALAYLTTLIYHALNANNPFPVT